MQIKAIKSAKIENITYIQKRRAFLFPLGLFSCHGGHTISGRGVCRSWGILNGCKLFAYYYIYNVCKQHGTLSARHTISTAHYQRAHYQKRPRARLQMKQHGGHVWGILNGWGCFFIHGTLSARHTISGKQHGGRFFIHGKGSARHTISTANSTATATDQRRARLGLGLFAAVPSWGTAYLQNSGHGTGDPAIASSVWRVDSLASQRLRVFVQKWGYMIFSKLTILVGDAKSANLPMLVKNKQLNH